MPVYHGSAPFLECSSVGDRRFSAFYAHVRGKTIEEQYQAAKVFSCGSTGLSVKEAKGKRPVNSREVRELYSRLWDEYMCWPIWNCSRCCWWRPDLSDRFGRPGSVCQATELWRIRNSWPMQKPVDDQEDLS